MQVRRIFFLGALTAMMFTGCHNKQAPPPAQNKSNIPNYAIEAPNDSTVVKPTITNGPDGPNVVKYENGVIQAKGNIMNGRKTGEWQSFFPDGKLQSDEYFTNGYPDGTVQVYYKDGKTMYQGQYRNGKPYGIWKFWNKDGSFARNADYDKKSPNTAM